MAKNAQAVSVTFISSLLEGCQVRPLTYIKMDNVSFHPTVLKWSQNNLDENCRHASIEVILNQCDRAVELLYRVCVVSCHPSLYNVIGFDLSPFNVQKSTVLGHINTDFIWIAQIVQSPVEPLCYEPTWICEKLVKKYCYLKLWKHSGHN